MTFSPSTTSATRDPTHTRRVTSSAQASSRLIRTWPRSFGPPQKSTTPCVPWRKSSINIGDDAEVRLPGARKRGKVNHWTDARIPLVFERAKGYTSRP